MSYEVRSCFYADNANMRNAFILLYKKLAIQSCEQQVDVNMWQEQLLARKISYFSKCCRKSRTVIMTQMATS